MSYLHEIELEYKELAELYDQRGKELSRYQDCLHWIQKQLQDAEGDSRSIGTVRVLNIRDSVKILAVIDNLFESRGEGAPLVCDTEANTKDPSAVYGPRYIVAAGGPRYGRSVLSELLRKPELAAYIAKAADDRINSEAIKELTDKFWADTGLLRTLDAGLRGADAAEELKKASYYCRVDPARQCPEPPEPTGVERHGLGYRPTQKSAEEVSLLLDEAITEGTVRITKLKQDFAAAASHPSAAEPHYTYST